LTETLGIEEFFRRRLGRDALYLPSARLALYLAFREWFQPGARLLMSSVTDDVVFFTVLAAGLIPVLAPVDPETGNMDLETVDEGTWASLRGVMTSNLYGMPERMDAIATVCRERGLVLIEDVSHAIDSFFEGRPLGTFGQAAAFSFSKHLGSVGGILAFPEESRRALLHDKAKSELRPKPIGRRLAGFGRGVARSVLDLTHTRGLGHMVGQRLEHPERLGRYRMPYSAQDVLRARAEGGGLDRFDPWVRVDNADYRAMPRGGALRATLNRLEALEQSRGARVAGARKIVSLGLTPAAYRARPETPFLRIPLLVRERERVRGELMRRGFQFQYIYDPALDVYARPPLVERLPQTGGAALWSEAVLPVDPLKADRFLSLLSAPPALNLAAPASH
jgi:hypothetical protein